MRSSLLVQPVSILPLFIATAPVFAVVGSSPVINATCAALRSLQPYDYCVGLLSADPAAAAATDVRGVATTAINITGQKAASTLRIVTHLANDLSTCRGHYSRMVRSLEDSLVDFRDGRFRNVSLRITVNATEIPMGVCDILLMEGNSEKDPLSEENGENDSLVNLAANIVDLFARRIMYSA